MVSGNGNVRGKVEKVVYKRVEIEFRQMSMVWFPIVVDSEVKSGYRQQVMRKDAL